jgi:hypothetical protein
LTAQQQLQRRAGSRPGEQLNKQAVAIIEQQALSAAWTVLMHSESLAANICVQQQRPSLASLHQAQQHTPLISSTSVLAVAE